MLFDSFSRLVIDYSAKILQNSFNNQIFLNKTDKIRGLIHKTLFRQENMLWLKLFLN